jgi:dTDP-4-amino-4,6-dideoxygalactose transaminase
LPPIKVPFNLPSVAGQELEFIQEAIQRGQISGDGYFTNLCSFELGKITGVETTLLTHSGTAALEMAAILCELKPGDEVIMPSFTFVSTANAVVLRGAIPVFVDVDNNTLNLDPQEVRSAVTDKTQAIFAVHYAGIPADMDKLSDIAKEFNLLLVEDAAQAIGATYKGRQAGSLGDMAAFSFHETKNIISGEGGALTIVRPELIERAEVIRQKGTNRSSFQRGQVDKYTWLDVGSSYLPGELISAFLYAQLLEIEKIQEKRLKIFYRYADAFSDLVQLNLVQIPFTPHHSKGNGHIFYLLLKDFNQRCIFIEYMLQNGITTPFHYIPLHSSPAGKVFGRSHGKLSITDDLSSRLVRLPSYSTLSEDNVEYIIQKVLHYFE